MSGTEAHPSRDILETAALAADVSEVSGAPARTAEAEDPLSRIEAELGDPLVAVSFSEDALAAAEREARGDSAPSAWAGRFRFLANYALASGIIFVALLGVLNWNSYSQLARAWLSPESLRNAQASITDALASSEVGAKADAASAAQSAEAEHRRADVLENRLKREKVVIRRDWFPASTFAMNAGEPSFSVEITPYDNRIVIPKLGKNVPLVNVENKQVANPREWERLFEKELEKGVIKYPGSANPGEAGNAFVFGHSSNFPWIKGDYNDVFALLDNVSFGDEVIVYFKQKKYVYVTREKHVIKPGYVNAMKGRETAKQLTLMTCWPVGTTLNRLIVTGELVEARKTAGAVAAAGAPLAAVN